MFGVIRMCFALVFDSEFNLVINGRLCDLGDFSLEVLILIEALGLSLVALCVVV